MNWFKLWWEVWSTLYEKGEKYYFSVERIRHLPIHISNVANVCCLLKYRYLLLNNTSNQTKTYISNSKNLSLWNFFSHMINEYDEIGNTINCLSYVAQNLITHTIFNNQNIFKLFHTTRGWCNQLKNPLSWKYTWF